MIIAHVPRMERKWHDLRKNPDDMPTETRTYLVWRDAGSCSYYTTFYFDGSAGNEKEWKRIVTAWTEFELFDGEDL